MSRNIRQKFPRPSAVVAKRRGSDSASSVNLSDDDDGYSAVEDISDSEDDDEENVNAAEEEHIISHELHHRASSSSPRPLSDDDEDEENDIDADASDEDDEAEDAEADNVSWNGFPAEADETSSTNPEPRNSTPVQRHVRFADVPSSDSDATDTDEDIAEFFPDLFVDQTNLDPAFRREIEHDEDESSNSSAFWDFHGPAYGYDNAADADVDPNMHRLSEVDTPAATPTASQEVYTNVSTPTPTYADSQELDGYETDGDTTEEDVPEPIIRRKTSKADQSADSSDSDMNRKVRFRPGKPRLGSFDLNSSDRKPIAVVNPISRKMMIFTPYRRHQLDLSPEQFNFQFWNPIDEQTSPILSNSGGLMMGAMFSSHTFGDFMNTQAIGPAEAFFPFMADAAVVDDSSDSGADDRTDAAEKHLDINDFITWEEGASSSDEEEMDDDLNGWAHSGETPERRPSSSGGDAEMLSHLNSETVSAFRRHQQNQKLLLTNQATADSLAFSSPYNLTALRGLKADRFQTAAAPLTPVRRHKKQLQDLSRSPLESVSQKRKASGEDPLGHKRQRSISDVNLLRI